MLDEKDTAAQGRHKVLALVYVLIIASILNVLLLVATGGHVEAVQWVNEHIIN